MQLLQSIKTWFGQVFDVLKAVSGWLFDNLTDFLASFLKVPGWLIQIYVYVGACLVTVFTVTFDTFNMLVSFLGTVTGQLDGMNKGVFAPGSPAGDAMTSINTFIPLDIGLQFMVSYAFVVVTCAAIRMTKSWIPTIG